MKKLIFSLNPDMYNKYKGLQNGLDGIAIRIAEYNFACDECDMFLEELISDAQSTNIIKIERQKNDYIFDVIHTKNYDVFGTITITR